MILEKNKQAEQIIAKEAVVTISIVLFGLLICLVSGLFIKNYINKYEPTLEELRIAENHIKGKDIRDVVPITIEYFNELKAKELSSRQIIMFTRGYNPYKKRIFEDIQNISIQIILFYLLTRSVIWTIRILKKKDSSS